MVRIYGKGNVLFALANPLLTAFARTVGGEPAFTLEERVLLQAERDGQRLANEGYRVVGSQWYEVPILHVMYLRVVYERDATRG